jgi:hypothetical protein
MAMTHNPGERDNPVPAKARPGLHRGGWAGHLTLIGGFDDMLDIALRELPPRCRGAE